MASEAECPSIEEICEDVCGASYDCCFCGQDPFTGEWMWTTLFIDCQPCDDAGP